MTMVMAMLRMVMMLRMMMVQPCYHHSLSVPTRNTCPENNATQITPKTMNAKRAPPSVQNLETAACELNKRQI
eukprot:15432824-Alexandrium_andersonii.AAC.1